MKKFIISFLVLCLSSGFVLANGPSKVAKADRSLWADEIGSREGFDKASGYEILSFIKTFDEIEKSLLSKEDVQKFVGRENISIESFEKYKKNIKVVMAKKYNDSRMKGYNISVQTMYDAKIAPPRFVWEELVIKANADFEKLPEELLAWRENSKDFYQNYIYEQIRLACLFPNITSEIDVLEKSEITGIELADLHFILTFDDGPSPKNGNTDKLIKMLEEHNKKAIFFVLGDNFVKRDDVKNLYNGFVVGSHGKEHKPHVKPDFFKESLTFTKNEIDKKIGNQKNCYFRPPYGQRSVETVKYLKEKNCQVMLWNIDSQDWSNKMSAVQVKDRIVTLMLLWRSGIVLFHDIHPKAGELLPEIFTEFENVGIVFEDGV